MGRVTRGADRSRPRRVAVVTGGSRGAGRGIALALGDKGYTVVVTGRTTRASARHALGGTIEETAAEVTRRGGDGVALPCDHRDDDQTQAVAAEVGERFGHVDVLVNNAFAVPEGLVSPTPFWTKSLDLLAMLDVGLRSSYVMTWAAAPLLIAAGPDRRPLVVMTSGFGATCYMYGPAYGAVKAGVDKMAWDMAVDFQPYGVTVVSLWLGLLRTERTVSALDEVAERYPLSGQGLVTESPEFPGRVIAALDADPHKSDRSGKVLIGAELGHELGVVDIDGQVPASRRPMLGSPPGFHPAVVR